MLRALLAASLAGFALLCLGALFLSGPAEAAVLKAVQSGSVTLANGSGSVTDAIAAVDLSKSLLVFSTRVNVNDPANAIVSGQISNDTTLTFRREGNNSDIFVYWSVIEFASGVNVQRGSRTLPGTSEDVSISAVTLARSLPVVTLRASGNYIDGDDMIRARLTSTTNLELTRTANRVVATAEWQVVEFDSAAVQSGNLSFASGSSTQNVSGLSAFDTSKAWLVYSYQTGDGGADDIGQKLVSGEITGPTSLQFRRDGTGQTIDLSWYLVEFTDFTGVQHAMAGFTNAETQKDVAISAVDAARSVAVGGYLREGGRSPYSTNDNPGVGWFSAELTSGSNLRLRRGLTGSSTANVGWFVITFYSGHAIAGRVFEDTDFAGSASAYDGGVNDAGLGNVDVELYTGAGGYLASTTSAADGTYAFAHLHDGSYKVRARSATLGDANTPPAAGYNPTVPGTWPYALPEMTWGRTTALIGGQNPTVDDTATGDNAGPGDNYVTVTLSGSDVGGVDFGFCYELIVTQADDANADAVRSRQGSLRQFIKNSNAISGTNKSWFQIPGL